MEGGIKNMGQGRGRVKAAIEKIVAWGGFASITHIAKYIQPGIDLITLDPKLSSSIIGKDAFQDERTMADAAQRMAIDIGSNNQEACLNARVAYIESGTDEDGLAKANRFGEMVYSALQSLPPALSTPVRRVDPQLAEDVTQVVFITLSRKAGALSEKNSLSGWLFQTTRYTAATALKIETCERVEPISSCRSAAIRNRNRSRSSTCRIWER